MRLTIDIPEGNTPEQVVALLHLSVTMIRKTTNKNNQTNSKTMVKFARAIITQVHAQREKSDGDSE